MATIQRLEDLEIWNLSQEIIKLVYDYSDTLPKEELYISNLHIKKTARSISDNIAEAHGRYYFKEKIRFWINSRGSLKELQSQLLTNKNLKLGNIAHIRNIQEKLFTLSIKLNNTIKVNRR
jgi:four helix bundle protein